MTSAARRKWTIAGTVMLGNIMAVLDSSIVNVALPNMAGNLGATVQEITWVVTGYILANVLVMPVVGMLSARWGRKRLYMLAIAAFTAASAACGLSGSLTEMVLFRFIQGMAGGLLITVPQAVLRETFPLEEQGVAMGIYALGIVLAPAIGPTLGGWLTDTYSWPWVFFINVPLGILNLFMVHRQLEDPPYLERTRDRMDLLGLGLLIVGLGSFQLMLEEGQRNEWFSSAFITRLALIAAVGLVLFIWRELTVERPAVNLRLLRNVRFSAATLLGAAMGAGLMGSLFMLPLFLENLLGFTAFDAGLALLPRSLAMLVMSPLAGKVYNRAGPRLLVILGLGCLIVGYWMLGHLSPDTGVWNLVAPQLINGAGFSLLFTSLSTAALSTIERHRMTEATGLYNVTRQVMGSIGIAAAATILEHGVAKNHDVLAVHSSSWATQQWLAHVTASMHALGADLATARQRALGLLNMQVTRQATVIAYNHIFLLVAVLFVLLIPIAMMLPRTTNVPSDMEVAGD